MPPVIRIIVAILTLLTVLAMLGFTVFAITIPHVGLAVTCFVLALFFGYFSFADYKRFFGKKAADVQNK